MTGGLPARPSLRRHFAVHIQPGEGVLLIAGSERHLLRGPLYECLVPLLAGDRSADELAAMLRPQYPPEETYYALLELVRSGAVREAGESETPETTAYWDGAGVAPDVAAERLRNHGLIVRSVGLSPKYDFAGALSAVGLAIGPDGLWDVVLADDYLNPGLAEVNRHAVAVGRPWILCKPVGREVWIGPLFVPGETSCWACLAQRLQQHRPIEMYLGSVSNQAFSATAATMQLAVSWLASALTVSIATGNHERLRNTVQAHDTISGRWVRHAVRRRPQCPSCGEPDRYTRQASVAPTLVSRKKRRDRDSDQRTQSLGQTFEVFRAHIGPVSGVITGLTRHHARHSSLVHAYSAGPNIGLRYHGLDGLRAGLASTSAGKGATPLRAKVSALGEALERYSGVYQGDEPRVTARMVDLEGAIHPNECMHFSEAQYRSREDRNPTEWPGDWVPPRFNLEEPADWTPIWSLRSGRKAYVPTMLVYYDCPGRPGERPCIATTNGAAAGNCFEEAVLHGLLELIERDCVAIWWYNRVQRPAVDLATVDDKYVGRMRGAYQAIGREFWILDLTNDLEVPCYAAVSIRTGPGPEEPLFGFGAHLDPSIAIRRALTELNQVVVARDATNSPFESDPRLVRWLAEATVARHPYLAPGGAARIRTSQATEDLLGDLNYCGGRLTGAGLVPWVLDHTRPDVGVAVAKVVVPGLRYFRRRLAPGRLYDVPVALGWIPRAHSEGELNPEGFLL